MPSMQIQPDEELNKQIEDASSHWKISKADTVIRIIKDHFNKQEEDNGSS